MLALACLLLLDGLPLPPIVKATRDFTADEVRSGDVVIISPQERTERTRAAIEEAPQYVAAVGDPEHIRELERWIGKGKSARMTTMPSGARVYAIREETVVGVVTVFKADGLVSDTDFLAVRILEGEHRDRTLWVRNVSIMVPLPKPSRPANQPSTPAGWTLIRGDRLAEIGRPDVASSEYRRILREWPRSAEAVIAKRRLAGIPKARAS